MILYPYNPEDRPTFAPRVPDEIHLNTATGRVTACYEGEEDESYISPAALCEALGLDSLLDLLVESGDSLSDRRQIFTGGELRMMTRRYHPRPPAEIETPQVVKRLLPESVWGVLPALATPTGGRLSSIAGVTTRKLVARTHYRLKALDGAGVLLPRESKDPYRLDPARVREVGDWFHAIADAADPETSPDE